MVSKTESGEGQPGRNFAKKLLQWNSRLNKRQMPWKGEKEPYKIWLSEVILQQTRVEQGLNYYQNFIKAFPTINELANAPEQKVFKLWEGLGYYSRCRNLIATAKYISKELKGHFPKDYESVLSLKGVGSYTASAIVSFAYNLPYAVLDGNVFRVLSRIFDKEIPIDSTNGKKEFLHLAQQLLPLKTAGDYNQAIMDFGATVCKPVPLCDGCFFNKECLAFLSGKQDLLPIKEKKTKITKRWLNYFLIQFGEEVLIQQRTAKDIWQNLFQFLLIETPKETKQEILLELLKKQFGIKAFYVENTWQDKQQLSHQTVYFSFYQLKLKKKMAVETHNWVKLSQLSQYPFPKTLQQAVDKINRL